MLGSAKAFGQSSLTTPFGSQSVFGGQMGGGAATNNAFAQNPFGTPNPLASSKGGSVFGGGTSTGVFGQSSALTFGAPSKQAFGSPMPAFGSSSSSSSSFGGSPPFGQKSTFGGFGSTPSQTSSYGSTFQQTQPAFGSNGFGSTPFGASSQSTFGASCAPAFGATSTPALGAATLPASGATITPTFRTTKCQAFGSTTTSSFGSTGPALGVSSSLAFGSTVRAAFGGQSTSAFGSPSTPAFGATSAPTFISAFGASTTSSLSFGSTPSFGQSTSACSSTPFGTMPSHFSAQSAPFGAQTAISAFGSPGCGQSPFGGQQKGSRVVTYTQTTETDGASGTQAYVKLHSISAMPMYKEKSHEELRCEDYQLRDKGAQTAMSAFGSPGCGQSPFGGQQKGSRVVTYTQTTETDGAGSTQAYVKLHSISAMPVYKEKSHEELRSEDYQLGDKGGLKSTGQPAGAVSFPSSTQANPFGPSSPSPFGGSATPALGSSSMVFGSSTAGSSSSSAFSSFPGLGCTQSSGLHQSTLSIWQSPSPCGQPSTGFQPTKPSFGSNLFSMQSTDQQEISFSNWVPSTLPTSNFVGFGQTTPSLSAASQPASPTQTSSTFAFNYTGQTRSASSDGRGRMPSILSQATSGQLASTLSSKVVQPVPVKTPFGTLPPLPQISTVQVGLTHSFQYGVSSMPVAEKPTPVRQYTLSVPKHLSRRRIRLPAWNYKPKNDGPKVPFFMVDDEMQPTLKADTLFVRRENPRSLVTQPIEGWTSRISSDKQFMLKDTHNPANRNAGTDGNDLIREQDNLCSSLSKCSMQQPLETRQARIRVFDEDAQETNSPYVAISGDKAGKDSSVSEHGTDIEALLPKLQHADYYTEPRIQELAAKERAEPGFCCHVKDFVVGRDGYGSIKFDGETDVRGLDLESIIQFNIREVIVYKDNSRKPPVGQGLNKPAEVTLLNLKCINKKTGKQYTEGPKVGEYKELLIKKAEEQGLSLCPLMLSKDYGSLRLVTSAPTGSKMDIDQTVERRADMYMYLELYCFILLPNGSRKMFLADFC